MGDEATTSVQTDTGDAGSTETVLTGVDASTTDEGQVGTETDSTTDANASTEDAAATDDAAAADAGNEGSDVVPDTYADFTMPEGMQLDETALTDAAPIFKELGLNQEQAQKVVDLYAAQVQAGSQKQIDDFNQLVSDWGDQSKNDSEFGGDKFDENVKVAQAAVAKYGTPELKQLLSDHGVGSHPEVVRFMVRVGHTLKEDVPGTSGSASAQTADRVDILYPKN
jgi:hypothetical protein